MRKFRWKLFFVNIEQPRESLWAKPNSKLIAPKIFWLWLSFFFYENGVERLATKLWLLSSPNSKIAFVQFQFYLSSATYRTDGLEMHKKCKKKGQSYRLLRFGDEIFLRSRLSITCHVAYYCKSNVYNISCKEKNKTSFKFRSKLTKAKREMVRNRKKIARGVVHRKSGRKFRVGPY